MQSPRFCKLLRHLLSVLHKFYNLRCEKVNGSTQADSLRENETVKVSANLLFRTKMNSMQHKRINGKSIGQILVYHRVCGIDTFCHKKANDSQKKLQKIEAAVCRPGCCFFIGFSEYFFMATTIILFICFVYFYEGIGPQISVRGHAAVRRTRPGTVRGVELALLWLFGMR